MIKCKGWSVFIGKRKGLYIYRNKLCLYQYGFQLITFLIGCAFQNNILVDGYMTVCHFNVLHFKPFIYEVY